LKRVTFSQDYMVATLAFASKITVKIQVLQTCDFIWIKP